jgi:ribosomal protein S18 acetylase RimI-like enzyme
MLVFLTNLMLNLPVRTPRIARVRLGYELMRLKYSVIMSSKPFLTVKRATAGDAELLFTVCRQSYAENFASHWNEGGLDWYLDQVYGLDVIQSDLKNPVINYFVPYIIGEPVGFIKLHLKSVLPGYPATSAMEIEKIYFRPAFQGEGIGKSLITLSINLARQLRKEIIWLGVIDTNESAIAFYQKMGFRLHDKTRLDIPYFKEELRGMWRMVLPLR